MTYAIKALEKKYFSITIKTTIGPGVNTGNKHGVK